MTQAHSGIESLLEPTLETSSHANTNYSVYSVRASFFVAFLGGPFAILFFSALNSRRLGRLTRDSWFYALAGLGSVAFVVAMVPLASSDSPPAWLVSLGEGSRGLRAAARLFALLLFGGIFLLHRPFHKAAQLTGLESPSPWLPGLACIVASAVLSVALAFGVVNLSGV